MCIKKPMRRQRRKQTGHVLDVLVMWIVLAHTPHMAYRATRVLHIQRILDCRLCGAICVHRIAEIYPLVNYG